MEFFSKTLEGKKKRSFISGGGSKGEGVRGLSGKEREGSIEGVPIWGGQFPQINIVLGGKGIFSRGP